MASKESGVSPPYMLPIEHRDETSGDGRLDKLQVGLEKTATLARILLGSEVFFAALQYYSSASQVQPVRKEYPALAHAANLSALFELLSAVGITTGILFFDSRISSVKRAAEEVNIAREKVDTQNRDGTV
ncbi:hypothetical protein P7C70_g860, partial [Phenoliferia sp. Uapishka_3]